MRSPGLVRFLILTTLLISCRREAPDPSLDDWLAVLAKKRMLEQSSGSVDARQAYADSLRQFVITHPAHSRGRHVYSNLQLEVAREMASIGRRREAVRFYRSVLRQDPANEAARSELMETIDRLSVSREKLLQLRKGMSQREVARILGKPLPGWSRVVVKRGKKAESWYYPREGKGLAGVHFFDGRLLTAELDSTEQLGGISKRVVK